MPMACAMACRARGRVLKSDLTGRVARARQYVPHGNDVHLIDNIGTLDDGIIAFLQAIGWLRTA